jgi:predicted O-methyltransferase YrrM
VTLEADPHHADVARTNLERAGLGELVDIRVGPALQSLPALVAEGAGPFDLVFIDADKPGYPDYLEWSIRLARPGTLVVADNVVRAGAVADPTTGDTNALGVRRYLELAGAHPHLLSTALQTVGTKGYDGLAISLVTD